MADNPLTPDELDAAFDEMLGQAASTPEPAYEKDRAELANEAGFTGTFREMLDWLKDSLVYGGIRVHDPVPSDWGKPVMKVETVTGGFSSDEHLLGRLERSMWLRMHWAESHRGGLTVYEFPEWVFASDEERDWLEPEADDTFETLARARYVDVVDDNGTTHKFAFPAGVELQFLEPDRDITEPAGRLIVRPWRDAPKES